MKWETIALSVLALKYLQFIIFLQVCTLRGEGMRYGVHGKVKGHHSKVRSLLPPLCGSGIRGLGCLAGVARASNL